MHISHLIDGCFDKEKVQFLREGEKEGQGMEQRREEKIKLNIKKLGKNKK